MRLSTNAVLILLMRTALHSLHTNAPATQNNADSGNGLRRTSAKQKKQTKRSEAEMLLDSDLLSPPGIPSVQIRPTSALLFTDDEENVRHRALLNELISDQAGDGDGRYGYRSGYDGPHGIYGTLRHNDDNEYR